MLKKKMWQTLEIEDNVFRSQENIKVKLVYIITKIDVKYN